MKNVRNLPLEHTVIVRLAVYEYAICRYEMKSFLGFVTRIHPNGNEVQVMVIAKCAGRRHWPKYIGKINYLGEGIIQKIESPVSIDIRGTCKVKELQKV